MTKAFFLFPNNLFPSSSEAINHLHLGLSPYYINGYFFNINRLLITLEHL